MDLDEGDVVTVERTFTPDQVRQFAEVTGDEGSHHLEADEQGRVLVHGLLTASMATEVGGSYDVLARTMEYRFHEPVYTGERIRCDVEFTTVEAHDRGTDVEAEVTWTRDGETVLAGSFDGVIRD
jgi:acyl dehydratase